jgi:signal transduction histidine kinase
VAAERTRIARELHDIISHSVSVMVVQAGAAEQVLTTDPDRATASLQAIQSTGRQARLELRSLLGLLRSEDVDTPLAPQPNLNQVEDLAAQMRLAGLDVDVLVRGQPRDLPQGLGLSLYRIVQEALTNVLRHSAAPRARVVVSYRADLVEVEVDGEGMSSEKRDEGFGLIGMRERVTLYGGELDSGEDPNGGYRVRARLPLATAER